MTIHVAAFEDWWAPYTEPVGSVGDYVARCTPAQVAELRDACRERLGEGPFDLTAWTWTVTGRTTTSR